MALMNLDESTKTKIEKDVELMQDDLVLDKDEVIELFESLNHEAPVQEDRQTIYIKMANNQQKFLDENLNTTADIAGYEKQLQPLLRRMVVQLNAPRICSVQPVSVPDSSVFALKPLYTGYKSTESGNPFVVVHGQRPDGSNTKMELGDTVNGNGGATGVVRFVEPDGLQALIEVTNAGNGFLEGDTLKGDITLVASFSNEMFFKQVLPSYTGRMATGTGERLGAEAGGDRKEFPEMGITIEKLPISVQTRKLKARVTIELLQDLDKLFGLDGKKEINRFMAAEIALETDMEIVNEYKKIARILPDFTPVTPTDAQGRWSEEMYKGFVQKINRESIGIAEMSRRGRGNILIGTSGVITALQSIGELGQNINPNNKFYIGKTKSGIDVYHDFYYSGDKDYVMLIRKGSSNFDAPLIYSPYIPLIPLEATDPETLQPVLGMMSRYGLTQNTLQDKPSDSVVYFTVDLKETPLARVKSK